LASKGSQLELGAAKNPEELGVPRGSVPSLAPPRGLEQAAKSSENLAHYDEGGAKSGALDSELVQIIERWPALPKATRSAILLLVAQ
jgi:hypothetical protein